MTLAVVPPIPAEVGGGPYRLHLNESPYGPLPAVARVLAGTIAEVNRYPEFLPDRLREVIAGHFGIEHGRVTVGAGATGLAYTILQESWWRARRRGVAEPAVVTPIPTFDGYPILARMVGMGVVPVELDDHGGMDLAALSSAIDHDTAVVVLCSPHNPTGAVVPEADLVEFLRSVPPNVTVLFDEAYLEFCDDPPDMVALTRRFESLVCVRTFSKAHGLAALRVGYAFAAAEFAAALRAREVPFAVNPAAAVAVPVALAAQADLEQRVRAMRVERRRLSDKLASIGAPPLPGQGNFVFLPGDDGLQLGRLLSAVGVLGKPCGRFGYRLTVGNRAATDYLIGALRLTAQTA
uniref:pyridoxal phosphate-dependent aminotransferase n=1 Tax=Gordonia sp. B7-2 TaxID=3420932 RepID=UPI003D8CC113